VRGNRGRRLLGESGRDDRFDHLQENLEQGISDALTKTVGRKPDAVACPGPVKAKIGETTRCELTGDGVKYGVTATITSNDNGKYQYSVKVDDRPAR